MRKVLAGLAMVMPLAGCATTSFAPPPVNPQVKANMGGASGCSPGAGGTAIPRSVEGAMTLTDNYIFAYRCAERELAEGRQYFQIPSFLAAAAGLLGPTLGMSNDAVLLTGAGAGVLNTGNSYWAPKAKAGVVNSARRAATCIKTEAVGISFFKTDKPKEPPKAGQQQQVQQMLDFLTRQQAALEQEAGTNPNLAPALATNLAQQRELESALANMVLEEARTGGTVTIDAEVQYFEMVAGALFSVESILAERLRDAGSADTAEIFAKLKELAKAHADAEKALEEGKPKTPGTGEAVARVLWSAADTRSVAELENAALQPKLQTCVLQAWL